MCPRLPQIVKNNWYIEIHCLWCSLSTIDANDTNIRLFGSLHDGLVCPRLPLIVKRYKLYMEIHCFGASLSTKDIKDRNCAFFGSLHDGLVCPRIPQIVNMEIHCFWHLSPDWTYKKYKHYMFLWFSCWSSVPSTRSNRQNIQMKHGDTLLLAHPSLLKTEKIQTIHFSVVFMMVRCTLDSLKS